jgi:hypothetical protein
MLFACPFRTFFERRYEDVPVDGFVNARVTVWLGHIGFVVPMAKHRTGVLDNGEPDA